MAGNPHHDEDGRFSDSDHSSLRPVQEHWDDLGVQHHLSQRRDMISLDKIVVPKERRESGIGSRAMQALTEHADKNRLRIGLTPSGDFGGSVGRLKEFYKGFGFTENKGRSRDLSISHAMIREPQTPRNVTSIDRAKVRDS